MVLTEPLGVSRLIYINIFSFAIVYYWSALTTILLPEKILQFVPEAAKGTALGVLTAGGSLILIFCEPIVGVVSDRSRFRAGRRRPFVVVGAVGMVIFLVLLSAAPVYWMMIASFILLKLFWALAEGTYPALLPDLVPESQRGRAAGYYGLLSLAGAIAGVWVSAKLLGSGEATRRLLAIDPLTASALATAAVVLICAAILWVKVREPAADQSPRSGRSVLAEAFDLGPLLRQRAFLWLTLSRTCWYFGFNTLLAFLLYFVKDGLKIPDYANATGTLVSIVYAAALPTVLLSGYWSDRVGRRKPFIYLSSVCMMAAGIGFILMDSYVEAKWAMAVWGFGGGIFTALSWAMATESFPETGSNARYLAIWISISQGVPWLIAPPIGGFLLDRAGFSGVFIFVIVSFAVGVVSFFPVAETGRRRSSET